MNTNQQHLLTYLTNVYNHLRIGYVYLSKLEGHKYGLRDIGENMNVIFWLDQDCNFDTSEEEGHDEDETEVTGFIIKDNKLYGVTNGYYLLDPLEWDEKTLGKFLDDIIDRDNIRDIDVHFI